MPELNEVSVKLLNRNALGFVIPFVQAIAAQGASSFASTGSLTTPSFEHTASPLAGNEKYLRGFDRPIRITG